MPPALEGWERPIGVVAGGNLVVATAARLTLQLAGAVWFAMAPALAAKADGFAACDGVRIARARTYRVAIDSGL